MNGTSVTNVIKVKYLHATDKKSARVKIISERFKQYILIGYHEDRFAGCEGITDRAIIHLQLLGFNILSIGEGNNHMYLITDTFKPLK